MSKPHRDNWPHLTYRQKVLAWRAIQAQDVLRQAREADRLAHTFPLPCEDQHRALSISRMLYDNYERHINAPCPWPDEPSPDEWHPAGPGYDGRKLIAAVWTDPHVFAVLRHHDAALAKATPQD